MGTSEGTVKSRLNYARKSIKAGVEEHERRGVKLYGLSPALLLLYFLRREAESTTLDSAASAAIASQVLSQAGSAASGTAAAAAETAAGVSAGTGAAAGISVKVVAAVLAGAVVIGGAALELFSRFGQKEEASTPPELSLIHI